EQGIGILITDHNVRETLKITDRSYLIKDGRVRTQGTPQQIVHDPIAISDYLGTSFSEDALGSPPPRTPPAASAPAVHYVVEQQKVRRLIERLKTDDRAAAAVELAQRGLAAVPALLDAMERRDLDLRSRVLGVLQKVLGTEVDFDPYAPESERRRQIVQLRESL